MGQDHEAGHRFKQILDGGSLEFRYPKSRLWGYVFCAAFFFLLAALPLYQALVNPAKVPSSPGDWLEAVGVTAGFLAFGTLALIPLARLRRSYEISDRCLIGKSPSGAPSRIELKDVICVREHYWRSATVIESSKGERIRVHHSLPGSFLIIGFARAAAQLNQHGANGERLIHLFRSVMNRGVRIEFHEHRPIGTLVGTAILVGTAGVFWIWYTLHYENGFSSPWIRLLMAAVGVICLLFAAFGVWSMISMKREKIAFTDECFELLDYRGREIIIPLKEICGLKAADDEASVLVVRTPNDDANVTIADDFPEFWAIAYFLDHMRSSAGEQASR